MFFDLSFHHFIGNEQGLEPTINIKASSLCIQYIIFLGNFKYLKVQNLQGYMVGNPLTNKRSDFNSRFEFAYTMALITKELFEVTKISIAYEMHFNTSKVIHLFDKIIAENKERLQWRVCRS